MAEDMDKRVSQFVQVRDALKRLEDEYDLKAKPLRELQAVLSGRLRAFMEASNVDNFKTASGTAHISTRYTASLADPDMFMRFVIEKGAFELIDRRANATAVRDYVKDNGELPPGCNLNGIQTVGVRRQSGT
jgi:hypothetical protein